MTRYSAQIHSKLGWEPIALFSDTVSFDSMEAFIEAEFQCGNSLSTACDNVVIMDLETGEIVLSTN